ncbi:hypothetical protein CONLIGDRAFT_634636 [Coniochaeta ligniaria NRRL 30616]|uniref:F-box domain-containing protein n=1 Tax=Coniochaeta ligniaria NRRL 30616 TaxID=1408157 RepID=A0A1J7IGE3_9PEZI|nr:hypothetical protein CONLIGDRAFT_634636 [Coniochaeta ligniaria NRRL 30616]
MSSNPFEAETEAIIRVTAYHRRDKDEKVISFRPLKQERIRDLLSTAFPEYRLSEQRGRLKVLPIELLQKVCLELDIESLFRFRQVSFRYRQVVTGIFEYRAIATYATTALLALFRTDMAKCTTLLQLYQPLTETWCVTCGKFGGFLFIPMATRCCLDCIYDTRNFRMLTLHSIFKSTKISLRKLRTLMPVLKTVPGWYGRYEATRQKSVSYVTLSHALEAMESLKGRDAPEVLKVSKITLMNPTRTQENCESSTSLPTFDPTTFTAYWGLSCRGCAAGMDHPMFPRISDSRQLPADIEKIYSKAEFMAHFQVCAMARTLWAASEGGTGDVSYLESRFSINGGFDPRRMVPDGASAW